MHDENSTQALILPRSVISLGAECPCVHDECQMKLTVWRPHQKHYEFKFVSATEALKWVDAVDIAADIWARLSLCPPTRAERLAVDAAPPSIVLPTLPQHRRSSSLTALAAKSPKRFQASNCKPAGANVDVDVAIDAASAAGACDVPLRIQRSQSHANLANRVFGSPNFRPKPDSTSGMCAKRHARSQSMGIAIASKFDREAANGCELNINPIALAAFQQSASVGAQYLDRESWTYALNNNQLANSGASPAAVIKRPAHAAASALDLDLEIEIDTDTAVHAIHRDRDQCEFEENRQHHAHAHDHDQAAAVCFISSSGVVSPPVIFMMSPPMSPPPPPPPPSSSPPSRHNHVHVAMENHDHSNLNSAAGFGELSPTESLIEAFDFTTIDSDIDRYVEPADQAHVSLQLQHVHDGNATMTQGSFGYLSTQMHAGTRHKIHMHPQTHAPHHLLLRSPDAENFSLKMVIALHCDQPHSIASSNSLGFMRVRHACTLHELRQQILAQFKISSSFRFIAQQLPVDIRFESMALCGTRACSICFMNNEMAIFITFLNQIKCTCMAV